MTDIINSIEGELKFLEYTGKSTILESIWRKCQEKLEQIFDHTFEDLANKENEDNFVI